MSTSPVSIAAPLTHASAPATSVGEDERGAWQRLAAASATPCLYQDPEWVRLNAAPGAGEPVVAGLREAATGHVRVLLAAAPLVTGLACRVSYRTLCTFPLRLAQMCGPLPLGEFRSGDLLPLLAQIEAVDPRLDALYIKGLPRDTEFAREATQLGQLSRDWFYYQVAPHAKHDLIELPSSFDEYLDGLSRNGRKDVKRALKQFTQACNGEMALVRVVDPEQVDWYVEQLRVLCPRTWQWQRMPQYRIELSDEYVARLKRIAARGWLRAYVLLAGEQPVAYEHCYQYGSHCYDEEAGHDPDWQPHQAGKALLIQVIEDLCSRNRPRVLDFGHGESLFKNVFGNAAYPESHVYLVRRRPHTLVAFGTHRLMNRFSASVRARLDRLGLRERVRHLLRGSRRS
jgi:GNAT acetyltransferase-like protein